MPFAERVPVAAVVSVEGPGRPIGAEAQEEATIDPGLPLDVGRWPHAGPAPTPRRPPKDLSKWHAMCRETSGDVLDAIKNRARDGDVSAARLVIEQAWGRVPVEDQIMTKAEVDAEMAKASMTIVTRMEKALTPYPGAIEELKRALGFYDNAGTDR